MKKENSIYVLIFLIGICIFSVELYINANPKEQNLKIEKIEEINLKNMAASASMVLTEKKEEEPTKEVSLLTEVEMEVAPASPA